jgi:hypothetical protein
MKCTRVSVVSSWALLLVFTACRSSTPSASWTGTWKEDFTQSHVEALFSFTVSADGGYVLNASAAHTHFLCDGKPYPFLQDGTIVCQQPNQHVMDLTFTRKGKLVQSTHRELSSDGKTMTSASKVFRPDGSEEDHALTYARTNASVGFVGAWREADDNDDNARLLLIKLTGPKLRLEYPFAKQSRELDLNGKEASSKNSLGQTVTLSNKLQDPLTIRQVQKVNGMKTSEGTLSLSSDGNTLVQQYWNPDNPKVVVRRVYHRQ